MGRAQTYGNEWIDYNQTYYQFDILADGIYKIDYSTLAASGIPVGFIAPEDFQVFGKQKELPLYVEDGGDGSFDTGDYILFYGRRNDGWLDSTLYLDPNTIGNPAYSLYNDTISYFLSWNSSTSNLRYVVETDNNFDNYTSIADYIWYKYERSITVTYLEGARNDYSSPSFYSAGEGWGRPPVNKGSTVSLNATTPYPYVDPAAPFARFYALNVSNSSATYTGSGNHHLQWLLGSSNTVMEDNIFVGYQQIRTNQSFTSDLLTDGVTPVIWKIIDDQGALTDYQSPTYYYVEYPRLTNFGGANKLNFEVTNDPQGKIRLDVTNVTVTNPIMLVHGEVPRIVPFESHNGGYSVLIPNSAIGIRQQVIYSNESEFIDVTELKPVNGTGSFVNYSAMPGGFEDALIMVYNEKLMPGVTSYETYRESAAGGGYNVLLANVDDLYMQFGGGIRKHINGIRRFAQYVYDNSTNKPLGLFLIGKGIREANYNSAASDGPGTRKSPSRYERSLVPSFGHPSSDVAITANYNSSGLWKPAIATGRISVQSSEELIGYLDKVKLYELAQNQNDIYNTPNKDWQKQIIHFAGGNTTDEQDRFQNWMNIYQDTIEGRYFGGNVTRIYKSDSDPLNPLVLSTVTDRIQDGVSLMTYFGHNSSNTSGFEINLDNPVNWNNQGKYPVMFVNSCYNGNIFQYLNSRSEDFVQIPTVGAIAYVSAVGQGLDQYLNRYTKEFYYHMGNINYGGTIGSLMQSTIASLDQTYSDLNTEASCAQMVLNGDPMLKLNWHTNPEIELLAENVNFSPSELDLDVDSIEMSIVLKNLGQSVVDTFLLEVTRSFPGQAIDSIYTFDIPSLHYTDTIRFKMPLQADVGTGINNFTIRADLPSNIIEQYDEFTNNEIHKSLFIDIEGIIPVVPYDYAVVPNDSVTVIGSTLNPLEPYRTYRFEIDTTDEYNSPEHRFALVQGTGGVKAVNPSEWLNFQSGVSDTLVCTDSTVYFWRVAIDSNVLNWRERSFQYIQGKEGWGQDHFFQFKNNKFVGIEYNRPARTKDFNPFLADVNVDAFSATSSPTIYDNAWYINGNQQDYGILTYYRKFFVGVIDPTTLESWGTKYTDPITGITENPTHDFGNRNNEYSPRSWKYFTFRQNNLTDLESFQNMIINEIPDSFYVVIYSPMSTLYSVMTSLDSLDLYTMFDNIGATGFSATNEEGPMAMFFKKGDPNSMVEQYAAVGDDVHLSASFNGNGSSGVETSPIIGPSYDWQALYWKQDPMENPSKDSTRLKVNLYNQFKQYQSQIDIDFTRHDSIINLNTSIDANLYPYISLSASYFDDSTFTPAQMDHWHVLHSLVPEAAIDGSNGYTWSASSDTLNEGETFDFAVDVINIFSVDMDSLLVNYWVEDANQIKYPINYTRQGPLLVGDTLRDTITVNTVGLSGLNSLWMEVNPYVNGSTIITDQPEQEHFNNLLRVPFYVNEDDENPILDVTFNGNHILNGDIIDPNSEIYITLKDENPYLIMDDVSDTTLFGVYLTDPAGVQTKIPFVNSSGETVMQWIPANAQNMRFKIIWPAAFEQDGTYTLFVQGTDRSGNVSGDMEYRVSFDVVHASTITKMMNYPNPFSTSTRFVFTLTGTEAPDDILIRIMTVSGRVVREITEDELGPIQIGRNITEYAWDGTDEFGDPLANGVYLYTVEAKIGGELIEHRESGADQYFKKNFGKMYLMR